MDLVLECGFLPRSEMWTPRLISRGNCFMSIELEFRNLFSKLVLIKCSNLMMQRWSGWHQKVSFSREKLPHLFWTCHLIIFFYCGKIYPIQYTWICYYLSIKVLATYKSRVPGEGIGALCLLLASESFPQRLQIFQHKISISYRIDVFVTIR